MPKLRAGSCFRDWPLQPGRRAEQAFVSVIADAYLAGDETRTFGSRVIYERYRRVRDDSD